MSPVCVADEHQVLAQMAEDSVRPDMAVCDYQLAYRKTVVDAVRALREYCGYTLSAIQVSGAVAPEEMFKIERSDFQCLTKPGSPQMLRETTGTMVKPELKPKIEIRGIGLKWVRHRPGPLDHRWCVVVLAISIKT